MAPYVWKRCKHCGRSRSTRCHISARGRCPECGDKRLESATRAMIAKSGPEYERWAERRRAGLLRELGIDIND